MGLRIKFKFKPGHIDHVPRKEEKVKSVFWNLTNACTHNCVFCYANGGYPKENELSLNERLNFIKEAVDYGIEVITLSGGEPLLDEKFEDTLKALSDYDFKIKICTNGYLLEEKIDKIINSNVSSIQLSLNSINKATYSNIMNPPSDAYEKAFTALETLLETDIHSVVSTVPLELNKNELLNMMEFCRNKGVETFSLYKPIPTGRAEKCEEIFIQEGEFVRILDNLFESFFEKKPSWLIEVEIPYFPFSKLAAKYKNKNISSLPCRAGEYFVGLTSDGYVIPCPGLEYEKFYCENIREESLKEILESEKLNNFRMRKSEKKCVYDTLCRGGCKAVSYGILKDEKKCDPYCKWWI